MLSCLHLWPQHLLQKTTLGVLIGTILLPSRFHLWWLWTGEWIFLSSQRDGSSSHQLQTLPWNSPIFCFSFHILPFTVKWCFFPQHANQAGIDRFGPVYRTAGKASPGRQVAWLTLCTLEALGGWWRERASARRDETVLKTPPLS